ncbi:MAG: acyl carrier protein [Lachnospiraceae bacterium]|nr:acyl carrier protein [Lachnospiraceae bacterium]
MTREEVYERLNAVFADVFDDDTLTVNDETTAADVDGWDSLVHITLIDAVEEEFDISFDMKTIVKLGNVGEMVDVICHELDS